MARIHLGAGGCHIIERQLPEMLDVEWQLVAGSSERDSSDGLSKLVSACSLHNQRDNSSRCTVRLHHSYLDGKSRLSSHIIARAYFNR